jgi:hypothetical protein
MAVSATIAILSSHHELRTPEHMKRPLNLFPVPYFQARPPRPARAQRGYGNTSSPFPIPHSLFSRQLGGNKHNYVNCPLSVVLYPLSFILCV